MMEIEPWAKKTLLLLQSKTEDAPYKLREMLVETIQQKYGGRRPCRPVPPVPSSWLAEFRAKKLRLNHDRDDTMKRLLQVNSPESPAPDSNMTDTTTDSTIESHDDVTIELVEDTFVCAVCSEICYNPYELLECAECHLNYHKECHTPPVSDRDVSDPRVVWYCRRCARTNKVVNTGAPMGHVHNNIKHSSKPANMRTTISLLSSTSILKNHFGGTTGTTNKKILSGKYTPSNIITTLKGHSPTLNIISADKRLQIMKKKAAKKQDKRIIQK